MSDEIEWDFSQLPCRHEEPPSKFCGSCMIVFGTFLGGPVTWIFIKSIFTGSFEAAMLFLLPFLAIGIGSFLGGLLSFSERTVTEFDGETFRYRSKSFFGSKAWDEPLSGYEGVLARSEYHSGNDSSSYTLYIIELLHPDEKRRITLWQKRKYSLLGVSRKECRRQHHAGWKKYCRQLGLPALKQDWGEDIGEYTRRDPEDLDKSVCQLRAEGRLEINFYPAAAVPERLKLNIRGDQLEVEICQPWMLRCVMLSLFVFPACFICGGLGSGNIVSVILGIFIGVLIVRVYKRWKYEEWLSSICLVRINRKGLHILDRPPQGETKGRHIRADAIRKVRVGKASPQQNFSSVVVETDAGSHAIGEGLGKDALEWLKNCILSKIAIK